MSASFKALRLFAWIYVALGFILMLGSSIVLLVILGIMGHLDDKEAAILTGWGGAVIVISLFMAGLTSAAMGQFYQVILQIEENTRPREMEAYPADGENGAVSSTVYLDGIQRE